MRIAAILNSESGTLKTMDLDAFEAEARAIFERHGHGLETRRVVGTEVLEALRDTAARADVDVLLVAGGDGTVSSAAEICFRASKPLAVLPTGTMNLFARSLDVPLDLAEALPALAQGDLVAVDIATANGRAFVHQFSVGIYARLVRLREQMDYRGRPGKIAATIRAMFSALVRPPRFTVEIATPGRTVRRRVSAVIVSNNPVGDGHMPYADRLDTGRLGIYVARPMRSLTLLLLMLRVMMGRWRDAPEVTEVEVERVSLHFPRRKRSALAVIDGELLDLDADVEIALHPRALTVLRPRPVVA